MNIHDLPSNTTQNVQPDLESRANATDHQNVHLWLRFISCSNLIESELRSRFRNEFQTTMPRFDLMAQLRHTKKGMKMSELSRHMMVTNGNITGITDQLEKEGMVERVKVASDRRSSLIRLTDKGRQQYDKMASAHEEWLQALFEKIPNSSRSHLFEHLGTLKAVAQNFNSSAQL